MDDRGKNSDREERDNRSVEERFYSMSFKQLVETLRSDLDPESMAFVRRLFIGGGEPREQLRDRDPAFMRWVDRLRREGSAGRSDEEGTPASGSKSPADRGGQSCKEEADEHSVRAPSTKDTGAKERPTSEQKEGHGK
ncbi:hypothetical protein PFICI_13654 [Pestalotiopsis fici W106-1]|uniref:Uncharacterized protein n=1 Tax=Pestalotiopsis fici (strain W106-1 / CGMCC3.15140) TaxID=1229662 RepID=W3WMN2_PESFW|nr:uncharacterized protein PFICI_13654 [Pestalotiopsis fici W106-1]ETS75170.1 hypothetical protein PFICI_13654 [Pestalotiopsis fici W106-1]